MLTTILPSILKGTIQAPASKSSMQRACAAALLNRAETTILNPGYSNDDKAALGVIQALGAEVKEEAGGLKITGKGVQPGKAAVNCGESGLGIRMFAPIIALSEKPVVVNGEGSLLSRPMDFFDEIFPQLGIRVISNKGRLPLEIQGPLRPRTITIDGSLSSQFLTGLLFAYAAAGAKDVSIRVTNLKSRPYIDLTLQVLGHFGWKVENRNYEEFYFSGLTAAAESRSYRVEGDWSGGAFLLVAGAIAGPITVKGLDTDSTQADKAILQALKDSGAVLTIRDGAMDIGPAALKAFAFDATDCPDLFPPLVALAAYCEGTTLIDGVGRLAHKESDRALTLQQEFGKLGVAIRLEGDRMSIEGGKGLKGAVVHSRHDHRIAMACAVAALRADGETTIEEAEAINKSYPDFYDHLHQLGADISIKKQLV
ncbi:3-phosphoshikimate 1-carboxyvinyltransferase [Flavitalea sp. BT771]|uniref:3-phosphoshikimate 1-carboxyvinyltransferase n=1 Tax=Flavitalea sp. BT771 TaxID=3063329 RepID=UPI0026E249C7|nr:3-phosphoshikimate 1-carboxyvinyltransferase [Flavitalea sp. BT771]MDO6432372.1 3-phosphoshikimate 1-carboxyvinyltransferase [Flavitalea sp. BT771]MDV6221282.1 3-phosphoshikimate 1-carboxyvinyltransferase [Flavitalea sp. BT771]